MKANQSIPLGDFRLFQTPTGRLVFVPFDSTTPPTPGVDNYLRPGGVDTYHRPDGTSLYKRP